MDTPLWKPDDKAEPYWVLHISIVIDKRRFTNGQIGRAFMKGEHPKLMNRLLHCPTKDACQHIDLGPIMTEINTG